MEIKPSIIAAHNELQAALTPYQARINDFKERYADLSISGIEDTQGYAAVKDAAKDVRAERLAAGKEAKRIGAMILDIKRQFKDHADGVVAEFAELEDGLRGELKRIDEERQEMREKEEREKLRRFNERTERLFDAGFTYNGYQYTSGLVFVAAADVADLDDAAFDAKIEEGRAEAERLEAERLETERKIAEAQAAEQRIAEAEAARRIQEADKDEQRRQGIEKAMPRPAADIPRPAADMPQQDADMPRPADPIPETFQAQRPPVTETVPPGFQAGFEACKNKVLLILAEPGNLTRKGLANRVAQIEP